MDIKKQLRELARKSPGMTRGQFAAEMVRHYRAEIIEHITQNLEMWVARWVQDILRNDELPVTEDDKRAMDIAQQSFSFGVPTWLAAHAPNGETVNVLSLDATAEEWESSAVISENHAASEQQNAMNKREIAQRLRDSGAASLRQLVLIEED